MSNRKLKLQTLSRLCLKYFGKDFEHWSWEIDYGNVEGYPKKIATAIELPKYDKNNNLVYTDPFIAKSGGPAKSLEIAADAALNFIEQRFIIQ